MKKLLLAILIIVMPILLGGLANFLASIITMEMIMNCVYIMGIICFIALLRM